MSKKIDKFTIRESLGDGTVFRAEEELPGGLIRTVALKVLPMIPAGDKGAEGRFLSEVRPLIALAGHQNVVAMLGAGVSESVPWIAMEFVGGSLQGQITEQPAPPQVVARMLEHVAAALMAMHGLETPILHNDLKPGNILVDKWGNYKITDFGVASPVAVERTRVLTTVKYAAPELLSRELGVVCPATDLYALGHVAYELALGGRLYRAQFPGVFEERSKEAPPAKWMAWHCSTATEATGIGELRKDFPHQLGQVIARMMAKSIPARYASAGELLGDLRAGGGGGGGMSIPAAAPVGVVVSAPPQAAPGGFGRPAPAPGMTPTPPAVGGAGAAGGAFGARRFGPGAQRFGAPAAAAGGGGGNPPAAAAGAGDRFWVQIRGKKSGPFDLPTLQRQARQGLVSRLHQISTDQVNWRSASTVEGLFT